MTPRTSVLLAALSLSSLVMVAGCATETGDAVDGSESDLSAAGQALIGSYNSNHGVFDGLILTRNEVGSANEFIADVDTGIRCVVAPCPSSEHIKGTFTAGARTITFASTTASEKVQHILGRYEYKVQGSQLSLSRAGETQTFDKVDSYCSLPADCDAQGLVHIMCVGEFSCTPQNTCRFDCGIHVSDPCQGLDVNQCVTAPGCQPKWGPSACSPDGICTANMAYKGCEPKRAEPVTCMSSGSCGANEHCSTEDGVCNSSGMLAVCSGTCVPGATQ